MSPKPLVPYTTPRVRALFNGTTEDREIEVDRQAPAEYWQCVGVDPSKLPHMQEKPQ